MKNHSTRHATAARTPEATNMYRILKTFGSPLVRLFFRVRGQGLGNIPRDGPFILAANHVSYLDPIVLGVTCPRPIRFIMLREFWEKPLLGWICRKAGSFPVDLQRPATGAMRQAITVLRRGQVLGIFPEGGRSGDGRLGQGKNGVALLALKTGLPLIPAAIMGAERAMPKGMILPRPARITVSYGVPLTFSRPAVGKGKKELLDGTTETVMEAIADLARSHRPG